MYNVKVVKNHVVEILSTVFDTRPGENQIFIANRCCMFARNKRVKGSCYAKSPFFYFGMLEVHLFLFPHFAILSQNDLFTIRKQGADEHC